MLSSLTSSTIVSLSSQFISLLSYTYSTQFISYLYCYNLSFALFYALIISSIISHFYTCYHLLIFSYAYSNNLSFLQSLSIPFIYQINCSLIYLDHLSFINISSHISSFQKLYLRKKNWENTLFKVSEPFIAEAPIQNHGKLRSFLSEAWKTFSRKLGELSLTSLACLLS